MRQAPNKYALLNQLLQETVNLARQLKSMISGDRRFQTFTTLLLKYRYIDLIEQLLKWFKSL